MAGAVRELDRFIASMVLSGAGDALGYYNGSWEFCSSGQAILDELKKMGGLEKLKVSLPRWMVSDDTVMNIATAEGLVEQGRNQDKESLYLKVAAKYKSCMSDMGGRAAGATCSSSAFRLSPNVPRGYQIPFNPRGGGCGGAMRAMCIGLRYPSPNHLSDLIAVSVECGRMTHHHPTGYLGSLASALFVSYALQGKPLREWGASLLSVLPKALSYVESQGRYVEENKEEWSYFTDSWTKYLTMREILDGKSDPKFGPEDNVPQNRDKLYKKLSYQGWGGASGHDAPMIAYDALLGSGGSWSKLCSRGMFHGGDSDSTGVIAAACYGAMHGFEGVPEKNHKYLEYRNRLSKLGEQLYYLAHSEEKPMADEEDKRVATEVVKDLVDTVSALDAAEASSPPGSNVKESSQSGHSGNDR